MKSAPLDERRAAAHFVDYMLSPAVAADFASNTGYIPVTRGALQKLESDGYFTKRPNARVAIAQLTAARPWPWSPRLFRVQREIVQPRLERAIFGAADARAMLDEAQRLARQS
ncbi:MAG: hypothetical protein QM756_11800 [Polyangiaceae bacterium]